MFNVEEGAKGAGAQIQAHLDLFEQSGKYALPKVAVDSEGKLACTMIYGRNCFFVPLSHHSNIFSDGLSNGSSSSKDPRTMTASVVPFIVDLSDLGLIGPVIDHCFISGYGQPTLALLVDSTSGELQSFINIRAYIYSILDKS